MWTALALAFLSPSLRPPPHLHAASRASNIAMNDFIFVGGFDDDNDDEEEDLRRRKAVQLAAAARDPSAAFVLQ